MSLWIKRAIKKKGALRESIRLKWGKKAFTKRGTIKQEYIEKAKEQGGTMQKRAELAETLKEMKRK